MNLHPPAISDDELSRWREQGYVRLGHVAPPGEIEALGERIDAIMLGTVSYPNMYMQLCPSAGDAEKAKQSREYKGSSLNYRKIQDLEWDPLFLAYIQNPLFRDITAKIIGDEVSCFRAMFMNKPAGQGVLLDWHQDGTGAWGLSIDPQVTIWTALDDTRVANGCLRIVPGSHKSMIVPGRDLLNPEESAIHAPEEKQLHVEMERGEVILLHNWTLHSSTPNQTNRPRRAFSTCYIDAATVSTKTGQSHTKVFPEYVPVLEVT
jgi:phytanoyl-CoA hydroxylase